MSSVLAINGGNPVRTAPWPAWPHFGEEEKAAVCRVVDSQNLCARFDAPGEIEGFESEFAAYLGADHAIAVGNGTEGLHLAVAIAGIGVNDQVIVPTYTFLATATCVWMNNAVPIFADSEPETFGLDPGSVEKRITSRTKAIILVHLCGYPAKMDELLAVARKHDLIVIEDCSHAHGAEYHGSRVGTLGDIGVFSLQQKKILCTGDGGIMVTNNTAYDDGLRLMRTFCHKDLSYNYRMSELQAAIGRVRLKRLEGENAQRRANAACLDRELAGVTGVRVHKPAPDTLGSYYSLVLDYDAAAVGVPREQFVAAVQAEGVPLNRCFYPPVHRHHSFHQPEPSPRGCPWSWPLYTAPANERPSYEDGCCPVAEKLMDEQVMEIRIHPPVNTEDMKSVGAAIRKVLDHIDDLKPTGATA